MWQNLEAEHMHEAYAGLLAAKAQPASCDGYVLDVYVTCTAEGPGGALGEGPESWPVC